MIEKLLDQPYWNEDDIRDARDLFSQLQTRILLPPVVSDDFCKGLIVSFLESILYKLEDLPVDFYNFEQVFPVIESFIEKEGLFFIKDCLTQSIIHRANSRILDDPDHFSSISKEKRQLEEYLNTTNDIQEILETFYLYMLVSDPSHLLTKDFGLGSEK